MSLTSALNSSLSGLNVQQQGLSVVSQNIANANSTNYSRQQLESQARVTGGMGTGAVTELKRAVDGFLTKTARNQTFDVGMMDVMREYYDRAQVFLADPTGESSLATSFDNFFTALNNLSNSPELPFFRQQAISSAENLTNTISGLVSEIQKLRLEVDRDIDTTVENINKELSLLHTINQGLVNASVANQSYNKLFDERDAALERLGKYMDYGATFGADGRVTIFTKTSDLLNDSALYKLKYTPAGTVSVFTDDKTLAAISVVQLNQQGGEIASTEQVLFAAGKSGSVTDSPDIKSGRLKGLLELRDKELPKTLEQLDEISSNLIESFNEVHNDGVGFPPPEELLGTTRVKLNDEASFSGTVMIAVLDENGEPVPSPYSNQPGQLYRPLTIDFSTIFGDDGVGRPQIKDILKTINEYFGSPQPIARLGGVEFGMTITSNTTGPTVDFDLTGVSHLAEDITNFSIISVNGTPINLPATLLSGEAGRGLNFTGQPIGTQTLEVAYTDPTTGYMYQETFSFNVGAGTNTRNVPIPASGVAGPPVGLIGGEVIYPSNNNEFMRAYLVDANGIEITDPNAPGYIKLETLYGNYTIAIDELNSSHLGDQDSAATATGRGFSHFLGLNNFFEEPTSDVLGATALNISVEERLLDNPGLIAVGALKRSPQPADPDDLPLYTYQVGISSNETAERLNTFQNTLVRFGAAGSLPAFSTSFVGYVSEILSFAGAKFNEFDAKYNEEKILYDGFSEKLKNISGVNVDEELATTIIYQNAYAASARIVTIVSELFDVLVELK